LIELNQLTSFESNQLFASIRRQQGRLQRQRAAGEAGGWGAFGAGAQRALHGDLGQDGTQCGAVLHSGGQVSSPCNAILNSIYFQLGKRHIDLKIY